MSEAWSAYDAPDVHGAFGDDDHPTRAEPTAPRAWPPVEDRAVSLAAVTPIGRRTEMIRRIELWSALKVSLLLYLSVLAGTLLVGVALWTLGQRTGAIGGLENLVEEIYAAESYRFDGARILKVAAVVGPILAVLASLGTVFGVALFNGVSRVTGGLRVTVSGDEDEPA